MAAASAGPYASLHLAPDRPAPHHSVLYRPDAIPVAQPTAHQSTEGTTVMILARVVCTVWRCIGGRSLQCLSQLSVLVHRHGVARQTVESRILRQVGLVEERRRRVADLEHVAMKINHRLTAHTHTRPRYYYHIYIKDAMDRCKWRKVIKDVR